ncbi:hypothetical protein V6N11_018938 [Hibiscus sabdariffa]|uniref:Uncharacterized protein n=1 Tax=Hibiscus sabdariffa TaxID=183260 RepID=A0ABR2R0Z6_9ROSI
MKEGTRFRFEKESSVGGLVLQAQSIASQRRSGSSLPSSLGSAHWAKGESRFSPLLDRATPALGRSDSPLGLREIKWNGGSALGLHSAPILSQKIRRFEVVGLDDENMVRMGVCGDEYGSSGRFGEWGLWRPGLGSCRGGDDDGWSSMVMDGLSSVEVDE